MCEIVFAVIGLVDGAQITKVHGVFGGFSQLASSICELSDV